MKKFISLLSTSLVLLLATSTASAVPMLEKINGTLSYSGSSTATYNATEVTGIDFHTAFVDVAAGDYLTEGVAVLDPTVFTFGSTVSFKDLTSVAAPVTSFWNIEGFTFNLASILTNVVYSNSAEVTGNGYVTHDGYADTLFTWAFTTQTTLGSGNKTSFSASVPAPAGAALLGLALLGFGFARRYNKA